jgi:putative DNA primase/helicase
MQIEKQADGNGADLESLSAVTAILSEGEYPGLNDSSNADALVARHGEFIRHVRGWRWLAYDGTRWVRDAEGQVIERAAETLRAMGAAAFDLADSGERATITKHVSRSLNMHNLRDMVDRASSMITAEIDDFGRDPWLFNCPNGTLDLRTGELRPHRAADYITHVAGCNFNPDALDDDWDRFRLWAANDQQDMAEYIQRGIGYSLTGQIGERGLFFCYGAEGGNGKTTLLEAVLVVMGTYGTTVDPQTILSKDGNGGGIPNDLAALAGKRYVISSEPESGQTFRMGRIKRLTGGDTIQARFMHQEFFTFHPVLKLWLVANNKPTMTEKTNAAWDRVNMVPFDNHKPKNEQDQDLPR